MSVLVDQNSRIVVQGLTGKEGTFHARACKAYHNTPIVAGVTPGKGGQAVDDIPVFDTVAEAVAARGANVSLIFVPPAFAADAVLEAAAAGVSLAVCISEGIPTLDMVRVKSYLRGTRAHRPQLPRHHLSGSRQGGDHAPGCGSSQRSTSGRWRASSWPSGRAPWTPRSSWAPLAAAVAGGNVTQGTLPGGAPGPPRDRWTGGG